MNFKKLLIDNEKKLIIAFPEYELSIKFFIKKIEKLENDGDLFKLILANSKSKNKLIQYEKYHKNGYKSSKDILLENIDNIDISKQNTVESLLVGGEYTIVEISALANNFNEQKGMYIHKNNVILKSTIFVGCNIVPYQDRWTEKFTQIIYYLEREKHEDIHKLHNYKHKPNQFVYQYYLGKNNIKLQLFYNYESGQNYTFAGVFKPISLIEDGKAFILERDLDK